MKCLIAAVVILLAALLVACSTAANSAAETTASNLATATPTAMVPASTAAEEGAIRAVVEGFGKALQGVSLQSADAAQQIKQQYSRYVSPSLLEAWMNEPLSAPGRVVSSPWPDRIEIITLTRVGPDEYAVTGYVVEMTSLEVVKGGAAARNSIHLAVQRSLGGWLITEYVEDR